MTKVMVGLVVGLFLFTVNAQANCGKCGVGGASHHDQGAAVSEKVQKLTKELSLTDEQKGKVEGILKEKMARKHQIMEEQHKSMQALQEEFKVKLSGVLTPEQAKKWEAQKKDGHGNMGKCPMCKGDKMCKKCALHKKMEGGCPQCKDGKMCKKCMKKKAREEQYKK